MEGLPVVTVSYQYGSGGDRIAEALAEALDVPLYDRERLASMVRESEPEDVFGEFRAEKGRRFYALATGTDHGCGADVAFQLPDGDRFFFGQTNAIRALARTGGCVIAGGGWELALCDVPNRIHVFVTADRDDRIRRIMGAEKLCTEAAGRKLEKRDKQSACYCNFYTGERWGAPERYSLCLNSSFWGIEGAVSAIRFAIDRTNKC